MLTRRSLLAALPALPARGQAPEFPPAVTAAGQALVLNGLGSRRYLGFEVYRAGLYLAARSSDATAILGSPGPKLVLLRYRRDVPLDAVQKAWDAAFADACRCPPPDPLRGWMRAITAGDTERYLILAETAELSANDLPPVRVAGAQAARILLSTFIGPAAPTAALRRGLLGLG